MDGTYACMCGCAESVAVLLLPARSHVCVPCRYVDMYGPGMVVYWFGFVEGLNLRSGHAPPPRAPNDNSNSSSSSSSSSSHSNNDDDDDDDDREGWPCLEEVLVVSSFPADMRVS
jgi:hypothetical protein